MKAWKKALLVSLATATPAVALASTPGAGILGTRHDFATRANFLGTQVTGTMDSPIVGTGNTWVPGDANVVGQCSFCHTPHSAQSTLLLWNKTLSANNFTLGCPFNRSWRFVSTDGSVKIAPNLADVRVASAPWVEQPLGTGS